MRSDRSLLDGCLAGDAKAWQKLIVRYERLIYKIALKSGLSVDDADDMFQTVCLRLYQNLAKLRNDQHITGWLILTAKREAWRLCGQCRSSKSGPEDGPGLSAPKALEPHADSPEEMLIRWE